MSDYTPSVEASLETIAECLSDDRMTETRFRDECAMRAMESIINRSWTEDRDRPTAQQWAERLASLARWSYEIADAMVAERQRRNG